MARDGGSPGRPRRDGPGSRQTIQGEHHGLMTAAPGVPLEVPSCRTCQLPRDVDAIHSPSAADQGGRQIRRLALLRRQDGCGILQADRDRRQSERSR